MENKTKIFLGNVGLRIVEKFGTQDECSVFAVQVQSQDLYNLIGYFDWTLAVDDSNILIAYPTDCDDEIYYFVAEDKIDWQTVGEEISIALSYTNN